MDNVIKHPKKPQEGDSDKKEASNTNDASHPNETEQSEAASPGYNLKLLQMLDLKDFAKTNIGKLIIGILMLSPLATCELKSNFGESNKPLAQCQKIDGIWDMPQGNTYEYPLPENTFLLKANADSIIWYSHCEQTKNNEVILTGPDVTTHSIRIKEIIIASAVNITESTVNFDKDGNPNKRFVNGFYEPGFKTERDVSTIKRSKLDNIDDALIYYKNQVNNQAKTTKECRVEMFNGKDKLTFDCGRYTRTLIRRSH